MTGTHLFRKTIYIQNHFRSVFLNTKHRQLLRGYRREKRYRSGKFTSVCQFCGSSITFLQQCRLCIQHICLQCHLIGVVDPVQWLVLSHIIAVFHKNLQYHTICWSCWSCLIQFFLYLLHLKINLLTGCAGSIIYRFHASVQQT